MTTNDNGSTGKVYRKGQFLPGVRPPGSGRKPGQRDRKNQLWDELMKHGVGPDKAVSPFKVMYDIMTNDTNGPESSLKLGPGINLPVDLRFQAAKELSGYQLPKLKAIEHSAVEGTVTPVVFVCATEDDVKQLEAEVAAVGTGGGDE